MNKSEAINKLAAALAKAQGCMGFAKKEAENPFFKSSYADLASAIEASKKCLSDHGLAVTQVTDLSESGEMRLVTVLTHSSGQFLSGIYPIRPVKQDPQGVGSAITYARRYAYMAIVGLAAQDDDGNAATHGVKESLATENQCKMIRTLLSELNKDAIKVMDYYKVESLEDLSLSQASSVITNLMKQKEAQV